MTACRVTHVGVCAGPEPGTDIFGSTLPIGPLGNAFAEECSRNLEATVQVKSLCLGWGGGVEPAFIWY